MDLNKFFYDLDELLSKGKSREAVEFIQGAIDKAAEKDDKRALIAMYNEAGGLLRDFSKHEQAEEYYNEAFLLIRELDARGSESYGTTLINYGTCLADQGKFKEAESVFSEAVAVLSGLEKEDDYRMAAIYNNMSWIAQEQGNMQDAGDYLNKALLLLKRVTGTEGEQAASYTNLANLYWAQEAFEEAKVMLIKAIDIYKDRESLKSEGRYAAAISSLANIYFSEGEYEKCAVLCREAMKEIEKEFGQNDAWHIISDNLAEADRKLDDSDSDMTSDSAGK